MTFAEVSPFDIPRRAKVDVGPVTPFDADIYDRYVASYNLDPRVHDAYRRVQAKDRVWIVLPEFDLRDMDCPDSGRIVDCREMDDPIDIIDAFVNEMVSVSSERVCIDITAMPTLYLVGLVRRLVECDAQSVDFVYGEPPSYLHEERTRFSDEQVLEVRQIPGCEGVHSEDAGDDLLLVQVGYDDVVVKTICQDRAQAYKHYFFGFPPLRPDMYQESKIRMREIAEDIGDLGEVNQHYAPAADPFQNVERLWECMNNARSRQSTNIYFSPLATKPMALGCALYYCAYWRNRNASIIMPICRHYPRCTATSAGAIWNFSVDTDSINNWSIEWPHRHE